jgi:hypothetical protein
VALFDYVWRARHRLSRVRFRFPQIKSVEHARFSRPISRNNEVCTYAAGLPVARSRMAALCVARNPARIAPGWGDVAGAQSVAVRPGAVVVERIHHQLGFGSGGYTGFAGTKPFRFGISTLGRLLASMTSFSPMMPFRYNRNATTA